MQMIRQYHHCDDVERRGLPDFSHGVAKDINVFREEIALAIGEIDSEEICGTGDVRSAVSHRGHLIEYWAGEALAEPTCLLKSQSGFIVNNSHLRYDGFAV